MMELRKCTVCGYKWRTRLDTDRCPRHRDSEGPALGDLADMVSFLIGPDLVSQDGAAAALLRRADVQRLWALDELVRLSDELGLYDPPPQETP